MIFPKKLWLNLTDKMGFSVFHPQYLAKRIFPWFVKKTQKYAGGKLIDIGCGTQHFKKDYLPFIDSYTGLDHPATAKMYSTDNKPDIFGDLLNLPLKNNSYNTVLLFEVLEHIKDPQKAISEVRRILRPNGYLLFTVPFMYPIHDVPYDYLRYTKFYLKNLFEKSGLKIVKLYSVGNFWEFWFIYLFQFCLIQIKELLRKLSLKNFLLILLISIIFVPIYLTTNSVFYIINKFKKGIAISELFAFEYFLIAKKSN